MTLQKYLYSKQFKKDYACWGYDYELYDTNGEVIDGDAYHLWDDEVFEEFIQKHHVVNVEQGWKLGDDHEMYAFAKITIK